MTCGWSLRTIHNKSTNYGRRQTRRRCRLRHLQTSRWGVYEGWDTRSLVEYQGVGYFGNNNGQIIEMEVTGADDGNPYTYQCSLAADHLEAPGLQKTIKAGRSTFLSYQNLAPQVSASVDYNTAFPTPPNAGPEVGAESSWDTGLWDEAIWDGGLAVQARSKWFSIGRTGFVASPQVQGTMANTLAPDAELVSIDLSYVTGGLHVA